MQTYQRRAVRLLRYLIRLANETKRLLHVRLVKGAYWDAEIKRAQERGLPSYPVFTRKPNTDVSYLACARIVLRAGPNLYTAVRDAQRAHRRRDLRTSRASTTASSSSSACTAWARSCTRR